VKPGDLRRFRDTLFAMGASPFEGSTFMVLRVNDSGCRAGRRLVVDILIDGNVETDLGYSWVEDSSEAVNEAG
jgi:hypothetical protein